MYPVNVTNCKHDHVPNPHTLFTPNPVSMFDIYLHLI